MLPSPKEKALETSCSASPFLSSVLPLPSPTPSGEEGLRALSGSTSTSLCLEVGELLLDKPVCLAALKSTSRAVTDYLVGTIHVERFHCPGCLLDNWSQLQIPPALPAPELGFHGECILVLHLKAQSFWEVFCHECHSLPVALSCYTGGGPLALPLGGGCLPSRDALKASDSRCLGDRLTSFVLTLLWTPAQPSAPGVLPEEGVRLRYGSVLGPVFSHARTCPCKRIRLLHRTPSVRASCLPLAVINLV